MVLPNGAAIKMSIRYFEFQQFLRDFLVGDFGVVLRGGDALVAENFGKAFDGHVVTEGYRGGKGVTGDVEGELFGNAAMFGDFLERAVDLLVAGDG